MDKIIMENMAFYGYHGVMEEEKKIGQKFFVDVILYLDLKKAGETDDLNNTVNYGLVYEAIEKIVKGERYHLLEALAERISNEILKSFQEIQKINIKIKKPEAPVAGIFDYFAVQIERERNL